MHVCELRQFHSVSTQSASEERDVREVLKVGDAETYAKVALEIGAELHQVKTTHQQETTRAKRTIDQLVERVNEACDENLQLNNALASKNEDYKR